MDNLEITIGKFNVGYSHEPIVTLKEMLEHYDNGDVGIYNWQQLCDFRTSTCLEQFIFCPYNGIKINWKEIKKLRK